ncbi:hypothetical protein [Pseudotabrizicola sp. 4114]|uniref:hypothetical protein n=1 Tax=Pseudotabrizicola sp. 4114 TaxID=2817731 RepID=UPI0028602C6D|nr:hypothetical protein [Pseudorhodobacter sp. 4114]
MKLTFSPVRMDTALTASVQGDTITLNGEALDFGPLPDGATLPRDAINSPWIAGDVSRDDAGVLIVPLILPHGASAPPETCWPEPLSVTGGPVALPPYAIDFNQDVPNDED